MNQLRSSKKNPVVIGLHWSGGNDCSIPSSLLAQLEAHYRLMFNGFREAIGQPYIQYIYEQLHVNRMKDLGYPVEGLHANNRVYRNLEKAFDYIRIISAKDSPYWQDDTLTNGIFVDDHVHYTADVQKWFAMWQMQALWPEGDFPADFSV